MIMKNTPKSGETVTIKMFVHSMKYGDGVTLLSSDMSEYGYAYIGDVDISFTMPNVDPIQSMVNSLNAQIEKEKAEHHVKITQLEDEIQQLLAIGHDGGVV